MQAQEKKPLTSDSRPPQDCHPADSRRGLATLSITVPAEDVQLIRGIAKILCERNEEAAEWEEIAPLPDHVRPGKLLRAARLRADLTQKALAEMIGVPQAHISQYEKNKRKIPEQKARLLAEILKTDAGYFIGAST